MKYNTAVAVNAVAVRIAARNAKKRARQEMQALQVIDGIQRIQDDLAGKETALTTVNTVVKEFVLRETLRKTEEKAARAAQKEAEKEQKAQEKMAEDFAKLQETLAHFAPPNVIPATATEG